MAIDPSRLTQSELLQLVNATPLGVVLTRSRLRRQLDAAALRFGDGAHIHLVRYVRWLVGEMDTPRPAKMDYTEARRRQAQRNRAATKASQDVYPVPEVEDYARRQACAESFRLFCETYFAAAFHRAWSDDHLRVIGRIEKAVRDGGLFTFAMPRGSGKTTLARCSALWATRYPVQNRFAALPLPAAAPRINGDYWAPRGPPNRSVIPPSRSPTMSTIEQPPVWRTIPVPRRPKSTPRSDLI